MTKSIISYCLRVVRRISKYHVIMSLPAGTIIAVVVQFCNCVPDCLPVGRRNLIRPAAPSWSPKLLRLQHQHTQPAAAATESPATSPRARRLSTQGGVQLPPRLALALDVEALDGTRRTRHVARPYVDANPRFPWLLMSIYNGVAVSQILLLLAVLAFVVRWSIRLAQSKAMLVGCQDASLPLVPIALHGSSRGTLPIQCLPLHCWYVETEMIRARSPSGGEQRKASGESERKHYW